MVPSGCGAPGAFGSALGSKASDFLGLAVTGASITVTEGAAAGGGATDGAPETTAAGAEAGDFAGSFAEAVFDVLAELLELILQARSAFSSCSMRPFAWRNASSSRLIRSTSAVASLSSACASPGTSAGGAIGAACAG